MKFCASFYEKIGLGWNPTFSQETASMASSIDPSKIFKLVYIKDKAFDGFLGKHEKIREDRQLII